jgi:threonine dehydrogenase-like Zn-dependent dehydrogenase
MKAVCYYAKEDLRVMDVPEPVIVNPHDCIVKVTTAAICGSDLHLYGGFVPTMMRGDILGHEFMGEVVEVGPEVRNVAIGDRVVVPFPIACGKCWFCKTQQFSLCDNTNPNGWMAEAAFGHSPAGIFGYSHLTGGYSGGMAEYVRVPFADVGPLKIDQDEITDEQVLFLGDILPTGWMAAEMCEIQRGDVVAVWGCGPVGQFAIRSAQLLGAERVIAIDRFRPRLELAQRHGAEVLDYEEVQVLEALKDLTGGRGPDACIDAVGLEAQGHGVLPLYDNIAQRLMIESDRPIALREAILACRKGGVVSLAGVYGGFSDKIPMGAAFNKGLRFRMGQTHVQRYIRQLYERIDDFTPTDIITHRLPLEAAPHGFEIFRDKTDECVKVVLKPGAQIGDGPRTQLP